MLSRGRQGRLLVRRIVVEGWAFGMIVRLLQMLLLLLGFSLPFEAIDPVLTVSGLEVTSLELIAFGCLSVWVAGSLVEARPPWTGGSGSGVEGWGGVFRRPVVWAPVLLLAVGLISAALAPTQRMEALKFTARTGVGVLAFWMVIDTVRSGPLRMQLLWALVAGAGVSASIGLGEALGWSWSAPLLPLFKVAPTLVGGTLRVGASFPYATMAAAYFEVAAVLALALVVAARRWPARLAALAVALLATTNVVLTLSRAGMVTLATLLLIVVLGSWRRPSLRIAMIPAGITLLALIGTTATMAWATEGFRTRLVTENDLEWYDARYSVPDSLELVGGEAAEVRIGLRNTGAIRWHTEGTNAFQLGHYWLTADGRPVGGGHVEVDLPEPVPPGDSVAMAVPITPRLPPGEYRLAWGMLQHRILWFRHRNVPEAHTAVRVDPPEDDRAPPPLEFATEVPGGETPVVPPTVGRLDLWEAALRMWIARPLFGVGPDNFRHTYGAYLGLSDWDDGIHSNNLYLELLAGWGLVGALSFAGVVVVIGRRWLEFWRCSQGQDAVDALMLGAAFLAFFVHGLLDYFLAFTGHYLLFWMVAGLIVSGATQMPSGAPCRSR